MAQNIGSQIDPNTHGDLICGKGAPQNLWKNERLLLLLLLFITWHQNNLVTLRRSEIPNPHFAP
jgi:hypothetical protein